MVPIPSYVHFPLIDRYEATVADDLYRGDDNDDPPEMDQRVMGEAALAEARALSNGNKLPEGYPCSICSRTFATTAGLARHVSMTHARAAKREGITIEQHAARQALIDGDRIGRDVVDEDGLVACGEPGCSAKRGPGAIGRHRLSMHGVGAG